MYKNNRQEFVLQLIKDEIINTQLLPGFNSGKYFMHMSQVIFDLMGVSGEEKTDQLVEDFLRQVKRARFLIKCKTKKSTDDFAIEIYSTIIKNKQKS